MIHRVAKLTKNCNTFARFLSLVQSISILGWLHTGDLGYYDNDGEVFLVDRISEFINYRAIKISPAEIEALIQQHPAVFQVAVVPVPHNVDEEHAMAFVAKVPGKEVIVSAD